LCVLRFPAWTNIDHSDLNQIRQRVDLNNHVLLPIQKRLARYKTKELNFVPEVIGEGEIMAPRREFSHAIVHLLDNAFKFSPIGGTVKLALEMGARGGAMIKVEDEGPGIPVEMREKVFERYYQISQGDNREQEGLGVGLFIARAVFSSLGGSAIVLNSSKGCLIQAILPNLRPEDISYG
jgi:signal transduction histidine kinase